MNPQTRVVIYTTRYCPYCHVAKDLLKAKQAEFDEIDVTDDDALREKLVRMTGRETVPQIFIDGKPIGGYDDLVKLYASGKIV
ncbi:MAG: glutaredoxin 3 [Candidatus Omnitrophica bacterium]|nr:glutaredoxin 3 [Candidatus Omnitrophota bacterium]